eukprot:TRINITY_DN40295_c0_g1_i1.p1 TRINITY_DN40295_c0_g1~~TRINITY_DN40295_c0_g1_i1.p1  ORF type:complete len:558 (+),score=52.77 TRINITY_DN40295_c0_g1_i1:50-1723(+)
MLGGTARPVTGMGRLRQRGPGGSSEEDTPLQGPCSPQATSPGGPRCRATLSPPTSPASAGRGAADALSVGSSGSGGGSGGWRGDTTRRRMVVAVLAVLAAAILALGALQLSRRAWGLSGRARLGTGARLRALVAALRPDVMALCGGGGGAGERWLPGLLYEGARRVITKSLPTARQDAAALVAAATQEMREWWKCTPTPECWRLGLRDYNEQPPGAPGGAARRVTADLMELAGQVQTALPPCTEVVLTLLLATLLASSSLLTALALPGSAAPATAAAFAFGAGAAACIRPPPATEGTAGALRGVLLRQWPRGEDGAPLCMPHHPGATNLALAAAVLDQVAAGAVSVAAQWEIAIAMTGYTATSPNGSDVSDAVRTAAGDTLVDIAARSGVLPELKVVFITDGGYVTTYGVAKEIATWLPVAAAATGAVVIVAHPEHAQRCFWDLEGALRASGARGPLVGLPRAPRWGQWADWTRFNCTTGGFDPGSTQQPTRDRFAWVLHEFWLRLREFGPLPDTFSSKQTLLPNPRFGNIFSAAYTSGCDQVLQQGGPWFMPVFRG